MNEVILLRLGLAVGMIILGLGVYRLSNRWLLRKAYLQAGNLPGDGEGRTVLVYFTTPTCVPCKTIQRPAIEQVRNVLGERFKVVEIDATREPELARRWGVMSVPTTFILDQDGKARFVNNGIARADKLLKQIQAV